MPGSFMSKMRHMLSNTRRHIAGEASSQAGHCAYVDGQAADTMRVAVNKMLIIKLAFAGKSGR